MGKPDKLAVFDLTAKMESGCPINTIYSNVFACENLVCYGGRTLRASKKILILAILLLLATGMLALIVAQSQNWLVDRDFFTYWGGGRGLLDGVNLYQPSDWARLHQSYGSQWLENPVFIYAPPTAVLF